MLTQLWRRCLHYLRRERFDRELEEEMRLHLEMKAEEYEAAGMTADEARRAARRGFGNQTRLRELSREAWGFVMMETLLQDVRFGVRVLARHKGFTAVAVLTLALGIGANTAIFSVVNAVLLRPLPYKDPERLVMLWENDTQEGNDRNPVAPANFVDWQKQTGTCDALAFYNQPAGVNVTGGGSEPERVVGAGVSPNIFSVLGVQPARGRTFSDSEAAAHEVIISHGFWQRRFGGDPEVVGRQMTLDAEILDVVGVMPPEFQLPEETELWWANMDGSLATMRVRHFLRVVGRLKPGVPVEQARADFDTIARRLAEQYPETNTGYGVNVITLRDQFVGGVRPALLLLLGAVGFVLLIACANVANLMLARSAARQKEMAVRAALGAGRLRLVRQLLTESLLLAAAGGAAGLLFAYWGSDLLTALGASGLPRGARVGVDGRVLAFTFMMTLLTGLAFGFVPAWAGAKAGVHGILKEDGRGATGRRAGRRLLVVTEIACALMLLIGAGLLIKSFVRLQAVEPGFDPSGVVTMQFSLPDARYSEPPQVAAFYARLVEHARTVPGVRAAGAVSRLPLAGDRSTMGLTVEGRPAVSGQYEEVHFRAVTPDYFRALGVPLRAGRELGERDGAEAPPVVLVNETTARKYWPGADPVGRRVKLGPGAQGPWVTVVGVVGDVRNFGLESEAKPEVYVPHRQSPQSRMRLVLRTDGDPLSLVPAVRSAVRSLDAELPFSQVATMEELLARSVAQRRLSTLLLGVFAGTALLLAAIGIYGVMAYSVTQRTREIGIRMALGARRGDVVRMVLRQGMALALAGVACGLGGGLVAARLMRGLLYGVSAVDPLTFVGMAGVLTCVALLACYVPARRATKIDPLVALRAE
ncbi:MAG TPA: ABC transporter permease [Pyrinomonadaceae bacterium]|nr:ABC transporter permease [Pyrinomonadaceae bacterium]